MIGSITKVKDCS